jgi:hypothetical protein
VHDGRVRQDLVEGRAQRRDRLGAGAVVRGPEIRLRDHVVVRVRDARARCPAIGAAHVEDRLREARLLGNVRQARHADPEGTLLPAAGLARFAAHVRRDVLAIHARELPVRDARSDLQHFLARGRRAISGRDENWKCAERGDDGEAPNIFHESP